MTGAKPAETLEEEKKKKTGTNLGADKWSTGRDKVRSP